MGEINIVLSSPSLVSPLLWAASALGSFIIFYFFNSCGNLGIFHLNERCPLAKSYSICCNGIVENVLAADNVIITSE